MFARVAARVSRACAMNDQLVASGAVDTKLMWQVPRLALALFWHWAPCTAPHALGADHMEGPATMLGVEAGRLNAALAAAGFGGALLRSPFELSKAAEPCSACPDDRTLLLGWLGTVGDDEVGTARPGVRN